MLRNAQMGTTITKGGVGGQRGNKKWSISLVLFVQNWYKKNITLILFHLHHSDFKWKLHLDFCFYQIIHWSKSKTQRIISFLFKGRATQYKWGDLDSRAEVRIAQGLPEWMAGPESGLSVKADKIVIIYTRGIFENILLRNNLNFQECCKLKNLYVLTRFTYYSHI